MKFGIINTENHQANVFDFATLDDVYAAAGLKRGKVVLGTLTMNQDMSGTSIVVYAYGLLRRKPSEGHYFAIGQRLFEGNAVLSAFDGEGTSIDLNEMPSVRFFASHIEVEEAIQAKQIRRPQTVANGRVLWQWPGEVEQL